MKTFETTDWLLLNNIIFKIYSIDDLSEMRENFLEGMKPVIDFDSADFYIPPHDLSQETTVCFNCMEVTDDIYENYREENGIMYVPRSMAYRDTDTVSQDRRKMPYYKDFYEREDWDYSLHMTLGGNGEFLGAVTFYRYKGKEDFDSNDIFTLDMLRDHLALRLMKYRENTRDIHDKLTVTEACEKYGLTKQEHMILKLLMEGRENLYICERLQISVNTLKKHILNIYRKLGIKNRVQMFKMIKEKE